MVGGNKNRYKEKQRAGIRRKRIPAMEMVGWGTERIRMPEVALGRFSSLQDVPHGTVQGNAAPIRALQKRDI